MGVGERDQSRFRSFKLNLSRGREQTLDLRRRKSSLNATRRIQIAHSRAAQITPASWHGPTLLRFVRTPSDAILTGDSSESLRSFQ